jgi:hypothetical protein
MSSEPTNSTPNTPVPVPTLSDFNAAYESLRGRLEQKAVGELTPIPLEGAFVVQTLLGVLQQVERHREAIVQECPRLDPNLFGDMKQAIFALAHAESLKRGASGLPSELEDPMKEVRATRAKMKADLEPLVVRGILAPDALTLSVGNSARNVAFDVLRFANYMDQHAALLKARMWTTPEELYQARTAAQQLLAFAGTKEFTTQDEVSLMYQRAMSYVAELYEELRWAVRYARRQFGDADVIAPSLYTMRAQRGPGKNRPAPEEVEPSSTPVPANGGAAEVDLNHLESIMNQRPSDVVPRANAATSGSGATGFSATTPEVTTDNRSKIA